MKSRVPLTVVCSPTGHTPTVLAPVTFGVPVAKGHCPAGALAARLLSSNTSGSVAEVRVLDRWADQSARWVLVDARLPSLFEGDLALELVPGEEPAAEPAIQIREQAGGVDLDTGGVTIAARAGDERLFDVITGPGGGRAMATLSVTDETGTVVRVRIGNVAVETRGRLRAVVRLDGEATTSRGRAIAIEIRLEVYAGLSVVRVHCTVRNPDAARHPGNFWDLGDVGSILLKDLSLTMAGDAPIGRGAVRASVEPGHDWIEGGAPFELYQDSSGGEQWKSTNHINRAREIPATFRGYRLRFGEHETHGTRATPLVVAGDRSYAIGVADPLFWQNFPRAIEVSSDALAVRFFPGQYADLHELQGGEQKTHECFVAFGAPADVAAQLECCRARAIVTADPAWVMASNAVDFLASLAPGHQALADLAIEGPDRFEVKREVIDEFGWRHYGEIYGDHEAIGHSGPAPLVSHYNNQYDPVAGFALQFLRTADPRWWHAMSELASHVVDIDIYHTSKDKAAYNGGLFWHTYHYGDVDTATHRTYPRQGKGKTFGGGPSADHNYPTGLMLHYFLTGSEASRLAAIGLAEYVLRMDDGTLSPFKWLSRANTGRAIATAPAFYGPARASGNSLNALVDGHRLTGDPKFLAKAEQLVRRVVHPDDVIEKNQLDEPEIRWFYTMFLQALGKYLVHRAERGLIDEAYAYARASLLRYARWMADHEHPWLEKPEKLEFPTETWAAQDIRKSDIFCYAAMHAEGAERERFVERAGFFYRTSYETLSSMPTHALARPVVVLLTSGFLPPWLERHPGVRLPEGPHVAFGEPERFVPQRAIAEKRAKLIAAGGAVAALAALAGLIRALW